MNNQMVRINDNIIYPEELIDLAGIVLRVLDEQKILSLKDLRNNLGQRFSINGFPRDSIEILELPSDSETKALVLSYARGETGIIGTVSNDVLKYSRVIIKGGFSVHEYTPFAVDEFGNIGMHKKLPSEDFSVIRKELQNLTDPKNYI